MLLRLGEDELIQESAPFSVELSEPRQCVWGLTSSNLHEEPKQNFLKTLSHYFQEQEECRT